MANRIQRKRKSKAVPNSIIPENNVQFNLEVLWCIRQIEENLSMKKMSTKQAQEAAYSLNVLRSKTAPVIKKRQVMKASLGDYRRKMLEEQKKLAKVQEKVKLTAVSPSKNSQFFKKSNSLNFQPTGHVFRFNFETEIENAENPQNQSSSKPSDSSTSFRFIRSDNIFRFNFETEIENAENPQNQSSSKPSDSSTSFRFIHSDNRFRFNFETEIESAENPQNQSSSKPSDSSTSFRFIPSDNSFRFAFPQITT